jgi:hypothetical protein
MEPTETLSEARNMKSPSLKQILDHIWINKNTPDIKSLKVKLKKTKAKGIGIYAKTSILINEPIAHYHMTAFKLDTYKSPTNDVYLFSVYSKTGKISKVLVGDITPESLQEPIGGIPFWAQFANEPSEGQTVNSWVDTESHRNFQFLDRKRIKSGDVIIYTLKASRDIMPGEEIVWYYGPDYERNY